MYKVRSTVRGPLVLLLEKGSITLMPGKAFDLDLVCSRDWIRSNQELLGLIRRRVVVVILDSHDTQLPTHTLCKSKTAVASANMVSKLVPKKAMPATPQNRVLAMRKASQSVQLPKEEKQVDGSTKVGTLTIVEYNAGKMKERVYKPTPKIGAPVVDTAVEPVKTEPAVQATETLSEPVVVDAPIEMVPATKEEKKGTKKAKTNIKEEEHIITESLGLDEFPLLTKDFLSEQTYAQLQKLAKQRNMPSSMKKAKLIDLLIGK